MQHDTVIWKVISPQHGGFCSFRRRIQGAPIRFCKNAYNVLGVCNQMACPLANSRYATIREKKGECYLMIKTIERAHTPSKQWEKIKLSTDYMTALKQIDEHLLWWPKWYIHKCKLRLTKIHQFIIRSRKLALSIQPKLVRIWKPYERQQRNRERKAEIAAKISNVVKSELLERLHEGVYEGIYNFPQRTFQDVMKEKGEESEHEESEQEDEDEKEKEMEHEFAGVIESELEDEDEYETEEEIEEVNVPQYEYEYENEFEDAMPVMQTQTNRNVNVGRNRGSVANRRGNGGGDKRRDKWKGNRNQKGSVLGKRKNTNWKSQQIGGNQNKKRKRQRVSIGYQ